MEKEHNLLESDVVTLTLDDNKSLEQSDHDKEHPTSEISSCRSKTGNGFVFVYFLFQDGYQDQSANPECQISVKRSHSGTVIFHIIKYL